MEINDRFQKSIPVEVEINGKVGILISCQQESIRVYPTCVISTPDGKQLQPTKFAQQASLGRRVVPYQAIMVPSTQETLKQVGWRNCPPRVSNIIFHLFLDAIWFSSVHWTSSARRLAYCGNHSKSAFSLWSLRWAWRLAGLQCLFCSIPSQVSSNKKNCPIFIQNLWLFCNLGACMQENQDMDGLQKAINSLWLAPGKHQFASHTSCAQVDYALALAVAWIP